MLIHHSGPPGRQGKSEHFHNDSSGSEHMAIMSLRQYARHRGVALSAVQKAIKSQRIATLPDGRLDSDAADAGWKRNTRAYAPAVTRRPEPEEDEGSPFGASQYTKARAVREHYQARLAKIDYEERTGS
jgi:pyruvate/2-oxoglutarate dehydrogenase complex dihydrolipoamide acyltransferase (E2) component